MPRLPRTTRRRVSLMTEWVNNHRGFSLGKSLKSERSPRLGRREQSHHQPHSQDHEPPPPAHQERHPTSSRQLCSPAFCHVPPFSPPARRRKCLFSGEGPSKGQAVCGRLRLNLALGFRRFARVAPLWPANGLSPARAPPHGGVWTAVGLGKPRRPPWAAIWRDFRGSRRPSPRPAGAQTQAPCPVPANGGLLTEQEDGPSQGADYYGANLSGRFHVSRICAT